MVCYSNVHRAWGGGPPTPQWATVYAVGPGVVCGVQGEGAARTAAPPLPWSLGSPLARRVGCAQRIPVKCTQCEGNL